MTMLPRLREWLADRTDALAAWLWTIGPRLRPPYAGPLCPDCEIGPDVGDNCPICRESWEQQKMQEATYGSGYEDGYRRAEEVHDVL